MALDLLGSWNRFKGTGFDEGGQILAQGVLLRPGLVKARQQKITVELPANLISQGVAKR